MQPLSREQRPVLKVQLIAKKKDNAIFTFYEKALRVSTKTIKVVRLEQKKRKITSSLMLALQHTSFTFKTIFDTYLFKRSFGLFRLWSIRIVNVSICLAKVKLREGTK